MRYIQESFFGKPLFSGMIPYRTTINNGYTIRTQNLELIRQLQENEEKGGEVIDWFLFKEGNTILIDNNGYKFGCTSVSHNSSVQLDELISGTYYSVTFKTKTSLAGVIPFEILIRAHNEADAKSILEENLDSQVYEILEAALIQ